MLIRLATTADAVPFYERLGFQERGRVTDVLPDGTSIEFVEMERSVKP